MSRKCIEIFGARTFEFRGSHTQRENVKMIPRDYSLTLSRKHSSLKTEEIIVAIHTKAQIKASVTKRNNNNADSLLSHNSLINK